MRKRIASGILGTCSVVASTVVAMMWPTIDPAIGWPILSLCGVAAIVAIGLLLWPEKSKPADFRDLAIPPHREAPERKRTATDAALEYMEQMNRWAWARHMPPVDTSWPRLHAEAKAIIRKLDERLVYVGDALEGRKPIRDWRTKIGQQRVGYAALDNDPLKGLTNEEREQVRIAVSDLGDLDSHISEALAKPRQHPAERVAWMYKHRADKARNALQALVEIMEKEDDE